MKEKKLGWKYGLEMRFGSGVIKKRKFVSKKIFVYFLLD